MLHKKNKRYEKDRTYFHALHGFSSLSCGLHRRDANYGKPLGVVRSGADRDEDGVFDIIYPINLKEDEQKGLDGNGGVFSYITDIRRWLRTDCTDSA